MKDGKDLNYLEDISAAWLLVEKMEREDQVQFRFSNKAFPGEYWWGYTVDETVQSSTLMEAICELALKHYKVSE